MNVNALHDHLRKNAKKGSDGNICRGLLNIINGDALIEFISQVLESVYMDCELAAPEEVDCPLAISKYNLEIFN